VGKKENAMFEPSPDQLQFAEIWLDYDKKLTLEDIAKEIGIAYSTIWRWFQNNDFVNWINSKKDEILNKSLMARYRTAIRKATSGDFNFSKLLFEMTGDYTQKSEMKVTEVYDDYEKLTNEEIIEEFERDLDRYRATTNKSGRTDKKINQTKKD